MSLIETPDSQMEQIKVEYALRNFGKVICGCWYGITPLGEFKFDPNFARITYEQLSKEDKKTLTLGDFTQELRLFKQFNDWHLGEKLRIDSIQRVDNLQAIVNVAVCHFYSERANGLPYIPPLFSPRKMLLNREDEVWKVVFSKIESREFTDSEKRQYGLY